MASQGSLTFHEYNDETVHATLFADAARTERLDLSDCIVEFIYKTSNAEPDEEAIVVQGEILDAPNGVVRFEIGDEKVSLQRRFFRIDVLSGDIRKTAIYGPVAVIDL